MTRFFIKPFCLLLILAYTTVSLFFTTDFAFANPAGVSFTLQEGSLTLNQSLKTGYNLIGSPSTKSITKQEALSNLIQGVDFDSLKTYDGTAFVEATTLEPGKSYFIRMLRLATWTPPKAPKTTRFTYDGDGGRVKKELLASDSSLITSTTYIGGLYEKTGSLATKYVMLGDQRVATRDSSGTYFIHTDHLGSSNVITDATGTLKQLLEYTPYGSVKLNQGNIDLSHKFTGQRLDDTTGLYFYNARYYDHTCGRFISADSIVQNPSNPQTFNRYSYAGNNPVVFVDPSGNFFAAFFAALIISAFISAATNFAIQAFEIKGTAAKILNVASAAISAWAGGVAFGLQGAQLASAVASAELGSAALQTGEGRQLTRNITRNLRGFGLSNTASQMLGSFIANLGTSAVIGGTLNSLGSNAPTPKTDPTLDHQMTRKQLDALENQVDALMGSHSKGTNERMLLAGDFEDETGDAAGGIVSSINGFTNKMTDIGLSVEIPNAVASYEQNIPIGVQTKAYLFVDKVGKRVVDVSPNPNQLWGPNVHRFEITVYGRKITPTGTQDIINEKKSLYWTNGK